MKRSGEFFCQLETEIKHVTQHALDRKSSGGILLEVVFSA